MRSLENQNNLTITHIYHSGVMIETNDKLIIFDYFHEEGAFNQQEFLHLLEQHQDKDFYYFVTHGHPDHFSPEILTENFTSLQGETRYIFSEDTKDFQTTQHSLTLCKPNESFVVGDLRINTFGSTDQGVSYLVEIATDDTLLFHSGDLNWWHWENSSPEEQQQEKKDFLEEIGKLRDHLSKMNSSLDIGFVPIDPRLGEFFSLAGNAFSETVMPKKMFPLHFRNHYSITKAFESQCTSPENFQSIDHALESFAIKI